tara:strand:+ start:91 stop:324 length:234 start_codon:yes stop_codon:yes gene_type:complete
MNNFENEIEANGVKVNVNYYYNKGEPMVMYYPDGSGHPGEPPSAEIQAVYAGDVDIYELLSADMLDYIEQKIIELHL